MDCYHPGAITLSLSLLDGQRHVVTFVSVIRRAVISWSFNFQEVECLAIHHLWYCPIEVIQEYQRISLSNSNTVSLRWKSIHHR